MSGAPLALGDAALRAPRLTLRATAAHGALLRRVRLMVLRRWFGLPLLLLETTGRRSGVRRTVTLAYLPDGEDLVVVAANGGAARPPAWWLNLRAAGRGVADLGTARIPVRAVEVHGADRDRLWRRLAVSAPVEHYRRRAARPLPVVRLRPA